MTKEATDVSIVTANYNNGPFIGDFMQSVLQSNMMPRQLILIDDGSTDNSLEILEKFKSYEWLKIISLPKNVGFANALNAGISQVQTQYLLRIDPDDKLHPERINSQYTYLLQHKEIDVIGSNANYFNSHDNSSITQTNFPISQEEIEARYHKGEHGLLHGTVMGKSHIFKQHKYRQNNVPAEDYDIFARMLASGAKFMNLKKALTDVRIHMASISNNIKIDTVKKTFHIRDQVFGTKTSSLEVLRYYYHISLYRKYLFQKEPITKNIQLVMSALIYPEKVLRRLF